MKVLRHILVDVNGETEKLQRVRNLKSRTLKYVQIIVNTRERNTKHIPKGTLMKLAK